MFEYAYALGQPTIQADFRSTPQDFHVVENLGFSPSGEGEHLYLQLRKCNENTHWIAENIARQAKVKVLDVGYCGKKDRNAVTIQWFSIYAPKADFSAEEIRLMGSANPDGSQADTSILDWGRHTKKLRRGEHINNHFTICLRNIRNQSQSAVESRLKNIQKCGVPNYFGEQRFGRDAGNLQLFSEGILAKKRTLNRRQKYMAISAARSHLFNLILDQRVKDASWMEQRSGPLWGRGRLSGDEKQIEYEMQNLVQWRDWCEALEHVGLFQERRLLRLLPTSLCWRWLSTVDLELAFSLPPGEFATAVLRELASLKSPQIATS